MRQERTNHIVWRVTGDDPLGLLEATTTQHVADLLPGEAIPTCLLNEHGRVLSFLRVSRTADGSVLLDGPSLGADGVNWVARLAPLSRCTIQEAPDLSVVRTDDSAVEGAVVTDQRFDGLPGVDAIVLTAAAAELPDGIDDPHRTATGWPRFGIDVTAESILNDTAFLELATSFSKGCYRGQETVAKIRNLGHAKKRMVRVSGQSPAAWAPGIEILVDGEPVGVATSVARIDDTNHAIATIKASAVEKDATVAGEPCVVEPIVLADAPPPPPPPPRTLRLGMR